MIALVVHRPTSCTCPTARVDDFNLTARCGATERCASALTACNCSNSATWTGSVRCTCRPVPVVYPQLTWAVQYRRTTAQSAVCQAVVALISLRLPLSHSHSDADSIWSKWRNPRVISSVECADIGLSNVRRTYNLGRFLSEESDSTSASCTNFSSRAYARNSTISSSDHRFECFHKSQKSSTITPSCNEDVKKSRTYIWTA